MWRNNGPGFWLVALVTVLMCVGCRKQTGLEGYREGGGKSSKSMAQAYREGMSGAQEAGESASNPAAPAAPSAPKMPEVKMPQTLLQTCRVKVGDRFPEADLPDLAGQPRALRSLWGSRLTVVLFWSAGNIYAVQALEYLERDVAKPFGPKGVRVVGIHLKDPVEEARKAASDAGVSYVNLLDEQGAYFAKIATEKIPRVYLLDAAGKVLWFDIEYSTSTRRDLERAIRAALGEPEGKSP